MYYTIYKTTNILNGKFYIGTHKTKNINDSYLGSGKILKRAIEKHGIENFKKEILFVYDNPEDMFKKEESIVVVNKMCYNVKKGGNGGWDFVNNTCHNNKKNKRKTGNYGFQKVKPKKPCPQKARDIINKRYADGWKNPFSGKTHTAEFKNKMSVLMKERQSGKLNSQYGTCWITNGKENKKIKRTEIIKYTNEKWVLGRTNKV